MVLLETSLRPAELLAQCRTIETERGRERRQRWGLRTLDLDIVRYGTQTVREPDLTIPLTAEPLLFGRPVESYGTSASLGIRIVGRLKPDVTLDQARAHLLALWPDVRQAALPPGYTGTRRDDFLATSLSVGSGAISATVRISQYSGRAPSMPPSAACRVHPSSAASGPTSLF